MKINHIKFLYTRSYILKVKKKILVKNSFLILVAVSVVFLLLTVTPALAGTLSCKILPDTKAGRTNYCPDCGKLTRGCSHKPDPGSSGCACANAWCEFWVDNDVCDWEHGVKVCRAVCNDESLIPYCTGAAPAAAARGLDAFLEPGCAGAYCGKVKAGACCHTNEDCTTGKCTVSDPDCITLKKCDYSGPDGQCEVNEDCSYGANACVDGVCQLRAKIYVDPPDIQDLAPQQTFLVWVKVEEVTNLYGFEFKLGYDTNILDAQQIVMGDFLNAPHPVKAEMDDTNGIVWVAATSLKPAEAVSGNGMLARITFRVKDYGMSVLDLYDVVLGSSSANKIPNVNSDGYFKSVSTLTVLAEGQFETGDAGYVYFKDGDVLSEPVQTGVTIVLPPGLYEVLVTDFMGDNNGYLYTFTNWENGPTTHDWAVPVFEPTTINAVFTKDCTPGDLNGNGIVDAADVEALDQIYSGQKVFPCQPDPTPPPPACLGTPNSCGSYGDQTSCESCGCTWGGCKLRTGMKCCSDGPCFYAEWWPGSCLIFTHCPGYCTDDCYTYTDSYTCEREYYCDWVGESCSGTPNSCGYYDGQPSCESCGCELETTTSSTTTTPPPTCPGDISGEDYGVPDGLIDISDVMIPALAFGAYCYPNSCEAGHSCWADYATCTLSPPSIPPWNPLADLVHEYYYGPGDATVIEVDDIMIPALAFGETC